MRSRRIAAIAGFVAVLTLVWTVVLHLGGGIDLNIGGLRVRSRSPVRPAIVGVLAAGIYVALVGWRRPFSMATAAARRIAVLVAHLGRALSKLRIAEPLVVPALALGVLLVGLVFGMGVAGGADSYGYMSQAELWRHGLPLVDQPWSADPPWPSAPNTFAPLGYRAVETTIKPVYAVGLPLLMAGAKWIGGHAAIFWLQPLAAAAMVIIAAALGRRLGSRSAGVIAAVFMATNWTMLSEMPAPMSDVIGAAGLSGALLLLLSGSSVSAAAAGLCAAIAVLVRPNLAPTLIVFAAWILLDRSPEHRAFARRRLALFLLGVLPGVAVPAWANWRLFGSPFESGYGGIRAIYEWSSLSPNLVQYPRHLIETQTYPAMLGLAGLLVPRIWPTTRAVRLLLIAFVGSVVVPHMFFEPAAHPSYLRYMLGTAPLLMAVAGAIIVTLGRHGWRRAVAVVGVAACAVASVVSVTEGRFFDQRGERRYPVVAGMVRDRTPPSSVIVSMQHSGTLRYYGGRMTLFYRHLEADWLDRAVDWLVAHDAHPYLVLDHWEVAEFEDHFRGQQTLAHLSTPLAIYQGGGYEVFLFDLAPATAAISTTVVVDRYDQPRYPLPVDLPPFAFRRP